MQSNTADPRHVSTWVATTLNETELGDVLKHISTGSGTGPGVKAFVARWRTTIPMCWQRPVQIPQALFERGPGHRLP